MYICLLNKLFENNFLKTLDMSSSSKTMIAKLKKVSTATISTCLFKRGLKNQYLQNVLPLSSNKETMVGEAFTLRYIPAREDLIQYAYKHYFYTVLNVALSDIHIEEITN